MHCRVHDCVCTYVDVCVYVCVKVYICRCGWGFWASGSGLRAQEGRGTIRMSASQLPASKRVNCPCRGDSGGGNVYSPSPVWSNSHFRFHAPPHFRDAPDAPFRIPHYHVPRTRMVVALSTISNTCSRHDKYTRGRRWEGGIIGTAPSGKIASVSISAPRYQHCIHGNEDTRYKLALLAGRWCRAANHAEALGRMGWVVGWIQAGMMMG